MEKPPKLCFSCSYTTGTGKFAGIKGKGTFTSYAAAPQQSYSDWEGELELP